MSQNGWRKPTHGLIQAQNYAKMGEKLSIPKTQAIVAVKKVAAHIGLKGADLQLLDTLAAMTQPQDWQEGKRPIVWSSNAFLEEQTGLSISAVQRHIRRLLEVGIVFMKDSPNGKRWGRRGADGHIIEAYGFDLGPLSARAEEFEALHEERQEERRLAATLRNKITVSRRIIRSKIEQALESCLKGPWHALQQEFASLLENLPSRKEASQRLLDILDYFKAFEEKVTDYFKQGFKSVENKEEVKETNDFNQKMTPSNTISTTHIQTTKKLKIVNSNIKDKKKEPFCEISGNQEFKNEPEISTNKREGAEKIYWSSHQNDQKTKKRDEKTPKFEISTLMGACPQFAQMARALKEDYIHNWQDLYDVSEKIKRIIGISDDAWQVASQVLGPYRAAASLALIYDKYSNGEVQSTGGYLRAMIEREKTGHLYLEQSFYGRLSRLAN